MAGFSQTTDDAALLVASARGDRAAFALFYRRHLAAVVAILVRDTGDWELAADLASEVFCAALLAAGRYRPDHPVALPWLAGIARHKVAQSRRRGRAEDRARRRLAVPRERLDDTDLDRVAELAAEGDTILALVERLPRVQREALRARVIEEREYAEIAMSLGTSEAAVRQNVSRALGWLRARTIREER